MDTKLDTELAALVDTKLDTKLGAMKSTKREAWMDTTKLHCKLDTKVVTT